MLRVAVIVLIIVCDNVFGAPVDTRNESFAFARKLINVFKKSGLSAEAKDLTKDLTFMVDILEDSFLTDYEREKEWKRNNQTAVDGKDKEDVVSTTSRIITTTEEEIMSNAILEHTEANQESTTVLPETTSQTETSTATLDTQTTTLYEEDLQETEPTTLAFFEIAQTEPAIQKQRPSSAFNSLLLQKIEEVANAMKHGRAALEFSTKWITNQEGFKNHHVKKRQTEITATTSEAVQNDIAAPQKLQADEMHQCISRWDLEQYKFSEKEHLHGLQKELEKMEELIEILKHQQQILDSMSDVDEKYYEFLNNSMRAGNIAQQQRLLQLLEVLNSKLSLNSTNATDVEEMVRLRTDVEQLKLAVDDFPKLLIKIEKKFTKEITNQNKTIFAIKKSLGQFDKAKMFRLNNSVLRTSTNQEFPDPQEILKQIKALKSKVDNLTASENQEEPTSKEDQQNPDLNDLLEEVEYLQDLVNKSLDLEQNPKTIVQLENEKEELFHMKEFIDNLIITQKQTQKQNDSVLGEPLHPLSGAHLVHFVTAPKIQRSKVNKDAKAENIKRNRVKSQPRSTDSDDIIKLLKELSAANDSSTTQVVDPQQAELQKSIMQLQRTLQAMLDKDRLERDKQKQIQLIADRIKTLENTDFQSKSLTEDKEEKIILKLLKMVLQQLERSGRELDDSSDTEKELKKLAESINRLQPKDNDIAFDVESGIETSALAAQFERLEKILAQQRKPPHAQEAPFTPQQMNFLTNEFIPQFVAPTSSNNPVFVTPPPPNGFVVNGPTNFVPQQNPAAAVNNNLFRDIPKIAPPQGGFTGPGQQQLDANPEQTFINDAPYTKQKIDDLKREIYYLQYVIATIDNPNYALSPEKEATINKLEQQIANLKSIVSGLNQYPEESGNYREVPVKPDGVYEKPRTRRSVGVDFDEDKEAEKFMEQTANLFRNFVPKEETQPELQQRSSGSYRNLHQKLLDLEKQLGEKRKLWESNKHEDYRIRNAYNTLPSVEISNKLHEVAKTKKSDIFERIITKIVDTVVDKIVIAIPIVIRKLFGITVENLADYNPSIGYNSVQSLKDLGVFGYLPLIALKFLDGLTYFINVLKKNKFVKTFLVPVLVVGGVSGLTIFLIWWMQPDDNKPYGYLSYEGDKSYSKQDYNNMYGYNTENTYDNSRTAINRVKRNNDT